MTLLGLYSPRLNRFEVPGGTHWNSVEVSVLDRERWHKDNEADRRIEELFLVAREEFGADHFFEDLLKTGDSADNSEQLASLLESLEGLCGSAGNAARWLFDSPAFFRIVGNDPYLNLEQGGFWTLSEQADWLKILFKYKMDPEKLYQDVFGYTS